MLLTVDGTTSRWATAAAGGTVWVGSAGGAWALSEQVRTLREQAAGAHDGEVRSPMPGSVIAVQIAHGELVTAGQALVLVEAMKMEHTLRAPYDGTAVLHVRLGEQVAVDQLLVQVTA